MRRRWVRRTLLAGLVLVVVAAAAFFTLGPGVIERRMNRVDPADLPDVTAQTQRLHDSLQVVDMHADTLMWDRDLLDLSDRGHVDLPRLREGNVALQVFSSVTKSPKGLNYDRNTDESDNITLLSIGQLQPPRTWTSLLERSLYQAGKLESAAERSDGQLALVRTRGDLDRLVAAREDGRDVTGALFSVEGLHALEGDLDAVDRLYDAGMRMAGFTHFFDNEVAGSMHGVDRGGLTDLGRATFRRLEERGVIVDVAHASPAAVAEMVELATRPLVLSHGGVRATCDVNRNLTDEQITAIAGTGGVIGIGYWNGAVCEASVDAVVAAIDHVVEVAGIEHVALGSDYDGSTLVGWDTSELAGLTQALVDAGYSDADVAAIMGGNTLRVMRAVLPQ